MRDAEEIDFQTRLVEAREAVVARTTLHGARLVRTSVTVRGVPLELIVQRTPERLRMGVYVRNEPRAQVHLDRSTLTLEPTESLPGVQERLCRWSLSELLDGRLGTDVYAEFARSVRTAWLQATLPDLDAEACVGRPPRKHVPIPPPEWRGAWHTVTRQVIEGELRLLHEALSPDLLAFVARFHRDHGVPALRRLLRDPTGRVAQLAAVEPGAFLLGLLLDERRRDAGETYFAAVEDGRPVNELVDAGLGHLARRGTDRARLRLLVRRSGPLVPPDLLLEEPLHFVPEDIPAEPVANARWHGLLRFDLTATLLGPPPPLAVRRGFYDFWSRHAGRAPLPFTPEHLWDYVAETLRVIDRRNSPARLAAEEQAWMERLWSDEGERGRDCGEAAPEPVLCGWSGPEGTVAPLMTRRRLFEEGRRMRHCVARYTGELLMGRLCIYHLEAAGEEGTLSLAMEEGSGPSLHDFRGVGNVEPSEPLRRLARAWLEASGVESESVLGVSASG